MIPEKQRFAIIKKPPNESNDTWDTHDEIVLFEGEGFGSPTWMIKFLKPSEGTAIPPGDGDRAVLGPKPWASCRIQGRPGPLAPAPNLRVPP